jgi:hypothetical protein
MSELPPVGQDPAGPEVTPPQTPDEILAEHLRRRGAHAAPRVLAASIGRQVTETAPASRWRLAAATWRPRAAVAVAGLTLVLLAGLLLAPVPPPRVGQPQSSSPPAGTAPATAIAGITLDPTIRALRPPEVPAVLATRPAPGTVLIVDDQIVPFLVSCGGADHCPSGELRNVPGVLVEAPPGGHLPYLIDPTIATTSIAGPLALEVGSGPDLVFLGAVVSNGLRLAFRAQDLAGRSATGGLFVIPGWLSKARPLPCPTSGRTPAPSPTSELGLSAPDHNICAGATYLTDDPPAQPIERSPSGGLLVQNDAYKTFASTTDSRTASQGVFLVRDWAGYGEVVARLGPVFIPGDEASAPSDEPTAGPTVRPSPATATGIVISVGDLLNRLQSENIAEGSIVLVSVPADAVSDRWAPGVVHSCPQLCPTWRLSKGAQSISVAVSEQHAPIASIVGVGAFLVLADHSVRALGPVATGSAGEPLDGTSVIRIRDTLTAVHGWLRTGPPLLCPQRPAPLETGLLGQPLSWSQCPGTWILPSADDPWAAPSPSTQATDGQGSARIGDASVPDGTMHVQDGGFRAGLDPKEGVWLVRKVLSNPCQPGNFCALVLSDHPGPGISWYELVGPIAAPQPDGVEQRPPPTAAP